MKAVVAFSCAEVMSYYLAAKQLVSEYIHAKKNKAESNHKLIFFLQKLCFFKMC